MDKDKIQMEHDPRILAKMIYKSAKRYWGAAMLLKIAGAGIGIFFILMKLTPTFAPGLVAFIVVVSEVCQWQSDVFKGWAEGITRKVEYHDGFGGIFSTTDLSDHLVKISAKTRAAIVTAVKQNYFASQESTGPKRAMENLQESAWWSKHLSLFMLRGSAMAGGIVLLCALGAFNVSISTAKGFDVLQSVNRVIVSLISLYISLGSIKFMVGYYGFWRKAEGTEQSTINMLKENSIVSSEAMLLLQEYQIARASAPLIPSWVWNLKQSTLNELWKKYRRIQ